MAQNSSNPVDSFGVIELCLSLFRQIERIHLETPEKKVAIVTFGSSVHVLGDGSQTKVTISENDFLKDFDKLIDQGKSLASTFNIASVSNSYG